MSRIHWTSLAGLLVAVWAGWNLHEIAHTRPLDEKLFWSFIGIGAVGLFFVSPVIFKDLLTSARETVVIVVNSTPLGSIRWGRRPEDVPIAVAPKGTQPGDPVEPSNTEP